MKFPKKSCIIKEVDFTYEKGAAAAPASGVEERNGIMIIVQNHCGGIRYTKAFFDELVSQTVVSCFGVAEMNASSPAEDIISRIPGVKNIFSAGKGVSVRISGKKISINIHISISYGTNAAAVTNSIKHKLSYVVEEQTGLPVERVNVYIDGLVS